MPSLAVSTVSLVSITEVLSGLECLLGFLEKRSFSFYPSFLSYSHEDAGSQQMSWKPLPEAESLFHSNGKDRSVVNNTLQPGLVVDLFLCVCIRAQLLQSCLTLQHYGLWLLASSVYGTLQARILEQIAMPSFSGSSQPWDQTYTSWVSCIAADLYLWATGEAPYLFLMKVR